MSAFPLLYRHFWNGLFESEMLSEGADPRSTLVMIGLLLGTPALPLALYLAMAGQANATAITLFFIAVSTACTAVATVILWPKLLPDATDLRVLPPLPLSAPVVLRAKLAALGMLLAALALLINVYAVTAIPAAMPRRGSLPHLVMADTLATAAAAALTFFTMTSVYAAMVAVLGYRRAAGATPLVQWLALTASIMALMLSPYLLEMPAWMASPNPPAWERAAPPMWFLGMQKIAAGASNPPEWFGHGTRLAALNSDPIWGVYARHGVMALAIALLAALVLYLAAFRRLWREALGAGPGTSHGQIMAGIRARFASVALPDARARSLFQFVAQTLERHPQPRLTLAIGGAAGLAFAGTGCLRAVLGGASHGSAGFRAAVFPAPLVFCFFLLPAVHYAFTMPVELPAHWIFRTGNGSLAAATRAATRAALWFYAIFPAVLLWALAALVLWGVPTAAWTTACDLAVAGLAVELLLAGETRIPFTSPHQTPPIARRTMLLLGCAALVYIARWIGEWEARSITWPDTLLLAAAVAVLLVAMRRAPAESDALDLTLSQEATSEWAMQRLFVE